MSRQETSHTNLRVGKATRGPPAIRAWNVAQQKGLNGGVGGTNTHHVDELSAFR